MGDSVPDLRAAELLGRSCHGSLPLGQSRHTVLLSLREGGGLTGGRSRLLLLGFLLRELGQQLLLHLDLLVLCDQLLLEHILLLRSEHVVAHQQLKLLVADRSTVSRQL